MFNTIQFGNRIAQIRREKNMTQEDLVELVGEDYISVSTLKRIESGRGHIDMLRIIRICKALGCELQGLTGETTLRGILEKAYDEPGEEGEIQDRLCRQHLFYPLSTDSVLYKAMPITTLMQFLIYLPLMEDAEVLDALRRIEGDIFDREFYVINNLWNLYKHIPDSKAKRYADYQAAKCTYDYCVDFYSNSITEADELWRDPERCEEMLSCHDEYIALIDKKKKRAEAVTALQE